MLARAAVAVAAGADFVVEGAVYFVLLCAEDGGEVVGHYRGYVEATIWGWWFVDGARVRWVEKSRCGARSSTGGASRGDKAGGMPRNGREPSLPRTHSLTPIDINNTTNRCFETMGFLAV